MFRTIGMITFSQARILRRPSSKIRASFSRHCGAGAKLTKIKATEALLGTVCRVLCRQCYVGAATREATMRWINVLLGTVALLLTSNILVAQDKPASRSVSYVPSLGDMMAAIQLRHSKLWYAAKVKNWSLADYELRQLDISLKETTRLYPDMPGSDLTGSDKLVGMIGEALKAKNEAKFDRAFSLLTAECNACHKAADRAFIGEVVELLEKGLGCTIA
jgi:hypothetical protein